MVSHRLVDIATIALARIAPPKPLRHPKNHAPVTSAENYLGSESCARCHDVEHTQWKNSLHIKTTKPIAEATVLGDFRAGTKFSDHGRSYTFGTKDGKPFVSVAASGRIAETFAVDYTLGSKRYQGYLASLADGRIYVLPVFWHVASKRWSTGRKSPRCRRRAQLRQDLEPIVSTVTRPTCAGLNIDEQKFKSTWSEMGLGCEACHGPGREHVTLMDTWEKDPALKPNYDNSSKNRQLSDILKILSVKSSGPRRIYDTCSYCHGNKRNVFLGFKGGDRFSDYATPFLISDPLPENDLQGEFWPDGRPNRFNRPQALTLSGASSRRRRLYQLPCGACSRNEFS